MTTDATIAAQTNQPRSHANNTLYLCPSDRAARAWRVRLARRHDARASAASCTHIEAWLADLWSRAQIFGMIEDSRELLEPIVASALWQHVADNETDFAPPECARVAKLAEDAWLLAHRHALAPTQIAAYAATDANIALYARLSVRVRALLKRNAVITRAELPTVIAEHANAFVALMPARIVLTPSFSSDPSLAALWDALRAHGVAVDRDDDQATDAKTAEILAFTDAATEMRDAITWAAKQLSAQPEKSVALIVPNLAASRDEWLRALRAQFNAHDWWRDPASDRAHFNLSAGDALGEFPYVHSLITLLRATTQELDTERIAQALLHPRWSQGGPWRYHVDRAQQRLLERGLDRTQLSEWTDVLPDELREWMHEAAQSAPRIRAQRTEHRHGITAFVEALTGAAWLPRSELFQLDEAWGNALDRWQMLDALLGAASWPDALTELQRIASAMTFQPKAGSARLQVMGLLESAGVPLDIARIVGFDESVLPERTKPNPMLPRVWQSAAHVGLGSQDEVDARAERLWRNWHALCGELSISYATESDGRAINASPLARDLKVVTESGSNPSNDVFQRAAKPTVVIQDEQLPPRNSGPDSKALTARTLEEQAQCPRRAAASRLGLRAWPEHAIGIPARVRGTLVHAVLAAAGQLRKSAFAANEPEPSDEALLSVASCALEAAIDAERVIRTRIPESVWLIERGRIMQLVGKVIALEKTRGGFAVTQVETELRARTYGQDFRVRLDRVDESAEAKASDAFRVVFDYKTGVAVRGDWFAERTSGRLAAPQLPLYALLLAQHDADAPPVRALGYVLVTDDDVKFVGVGEDTTLYKASVAKNDPPWEVLLDGWYAQLGALVDESRQGVADVAPLKGATTCRHCDVAAFCREPWSLAGDDAVDAENDALDGTDGGAGNE